MFKSSEKLWKSFSSNEGFEINLQCDMEIFGKYSDDRYEQRGYITYERLYEDNLNSNCQNKVLRSLISTEEVSLYKR